MKTQTDIELKIMAYNNEYCEQTLINDVCFHMGISKSQLLSKRQFDELVIARSTVAYFLRNKHGYSLPRIGKVLNRHHATIMNNQKVFNQLRGTPRVDRIFNIINKNYE